MVELAKAGSVHLHSGARSVGTKTEKFGLINHDLEMVHTSSQPTLASSISAPALSFRCSIASTNLGRQLIMSCSDLSRTMTSDPSMRPAPPPSPLSCARRLRQQRSASSHVDTLGDRNERRKSHAALRYALSNDGEVEAAIDARLRERGFAANPHTWSDNTPPSLIEQRREREKMKLRQRARANLSKRISGHRERGEPLPSDIPYEDRLEQVILRKMDVETQTMLQKVTRSRNSYQEVTAIPGAAEEFCKSVVMRNYVLC